MKAFLASLPIALALVACGGSGPVEEGANNTAGLNSVVEAANETAEAATDAANAADAAEAAAPIAREDAIAATIPQQYRGRWGLLAGDCTSTRGDAKGLITVGDKTVRFYESTATLKEQRPAKATSFSGLFGFTGEGQAWEKVMTFTRDGNRLERADRDGSSTYRKC